MCGIMDMAILATQVVDLRNTALNFQPSYWVEIFDRVNQPAFCVYVAKSGNGLRRFLGRVNNSSWRLNFEPRD